MIKKIALLFFFCFLSASIKAQVYADYELINQEKGLPSSTIFSIMQDSPAILSGSGTDGAGSVRYNGSSFRVINKSAEKDGFFVTDIVEDQNTNIVAATKYDGLFVYNGKEFIKNFTLHNSIFKSNIIQKLYADTNGVYCFTNKEVILLTKDYGLKNCSLFLKMKTTISQYCPGFLWRFLYRNRQRLIENFRKSLRNYGT